MRMDPMTATAASIRLEQSLLLDHPVRRAFDLLLGGLLLLLFSPLFLVVAALVRLTSPGPAFFVQDRIGIGCSRFRMYKFRTMRAGAEQEQDELARREGRTFLKIANDHRTTPVGRWLRRASIDELPQLINVLRGEMSLVGPRPLLVCDLRNFPLREQGRRFAVKPGITGIWQVSGRSLCTDEERMRLDLEYVERRSLALDVQILLRTVPAVLSGRGAN
jgi:lipopolysaccharide/colanic/teichoic acid biosynthesis glycosyltransferase